MRLEWLGQIVAPITPQGPPPQFNPFVTTAVSPTTIPEVTITPGAAVSPTPTEEKNRTLLYAAAIVGAGIVTAVVLSRVA